MFNVAKRYLLKIKKYRSLPKITRIFIIQTLIVKLLLRQRVKEDLT